MNDAATMSALQVLAKQLNPETKYLPFTSGSKATKSGIPALRKAGLVNTQDYYNNFGGSDGAGARKGIRVTGKYIYLTPAGVEALGNLVAFALAVRATENAAFDPCI